MPDKPAEREIGVETPPELVSVCGMKLGGRGPLSTMGELGTVGMLLVSYCNPGPRTAGLIVLLLLLLWKRRRRMTRS